MSMVKYCNSIQRSERIKKNSSPFILNYVVFNQNCKAQTKIYYTQDSDLT
jgi:hypothetical protein